MKKAAFVVCGTLFLLLSAVLVAQETRSDFPVLVNGRTLFVLHAGVGSFSPAERAQAVTQRVQTVLESPLARIETRVQKTDTGLLIMIGDKPIVSVTESDAQAEKVSVEVLAERWSKAIQQGVVQARNERVREAIWRRILITMTVLTVALLALLLLRRGQDWLARALEAKRERVPTLRFRGLVLVTADSLYQAARRAAWVFYALSFLIVALGALLLVFEQVPATQSYARQVFLWIWGPLVNIFWGVVGYLPNLFYILVIIGVTRLVIRGLTFMFDQADRGVISLEPWVHRDVAKPTSQILKAILIVLALFFIAPQIPGTGTRAAQGITVLIGLMVSFGSTSTVGNIIAGVVLTYMRPFKLGDRVRMGEVSGDVVARTFLYTKVLTIKNEEVVVPSLQVLSNAIVNYSAKADGLGLILHTSVSIGYEVPWRKVHELLLRAAERTADVLRDPKPFILQTSLDDWYVSYQLNVYTNHPKKMATIHAELHQNIQDSFNEGGVEILSPHYYQLRDGNTSTLPLDYRAQGSLPRRFLVDSRMADVQS
jgi:small-conductance mechanosensitive channel